jgi:hypothetical protein
MVFADLRPVVANVGETFSGSMVASHLFRHAKRPIDVMLIDRHGSLPFECLCWCNQRLA